MSSEEDRLADELASLRLDRSSARVQSTGRARNNDGERRGVAGWVVAGVAVVALGIGGFFVFREGSGRIFSEDVELGAVTLMSPSQSDVTLVATGYVYARKKANVSPKIGGRLAKLNVDEGSKVKQNEIIAELESSDVQAQLQQLHADIASARAKVDRARADLADATTRFNREKELLAKDAGTQAAFDDAKARQEAARTTLVSAEADVGAVEARQKTLAVALENTKVRAPFSGTILRKLAEVGEVIAPFTLNGIVTLASLDDLEVQADVAEAQFHKVKVGTPAEIILDAFPDKRFRGKVSELRQIVDRSKAAVTVKVKFTDDSTGVLPDMAAKVSFLTKALDDEALKAAPKLIAPADAVVNDGGRKVVFTIDDGHAKAVPVVVKGPFGEGNVELADGPATGTRVIRKPGDKIRDGVSVKEKKK
ncbi:MAG TPA: efflux RND transporter periplasmic adaptor subunit [Polyangia bacterium]|nr:efflux RND transporter periplasmic adaptor subunit [Polyangia bacterium]